MPLALAIDFGSTYTKAVTVDLAAETLAGVAQAPSTAGADITIGLHAALKRLHAEHGVALADVELRVAYSSAAGGLRMVAIGLVPDLTVEAARRAALGAGAKAVRLLTFASGVRRWAELHEQAFRRLGGTVRVVVLDNLREGVLKPDVYDPTLNPLYRDVLKHYGAIALPCRVGRARWNGSVWGDR